MIGSLIEFALVFVLFLLLIMIITVSSVLFIIAKIITNASDKIHGIIDDPIGSIKKVPQTLKSEMKELGSIVSKTTKNVRKSLSSRKSSKSSKSRK
jgi:predicted PurR-regulated permease PerM